MEENRRVRDRRENACGGLCDAERHELIHQVADEVRAQLEEEVYAKIGKSLIKWAAWATITGLASLTAWLHSKGIIQ